MVVGIYYSIDVKNMHLHRDSMLKLGRSVADPGFLKVRAAIRDINKRVEYLVVPSDDAWPEGITLEAFNAIFYTQLRQVNFNCTCQYLNSKPFCLIVFY